jgi:hypothetical protein
MSKEFICKRCGYKTNLKANLKTHLNNKTICKVLLEDIDRSELLKEIENRELKKKSSYNCSKCNKELSTRQSKWKHEKTCNKLDDKDLKELVLNLTKEIEELKKNVNITINNDNSTTNNDNSININIILENLRPFGKENYDYIDQNSIKNILKPGRLIIYKFIKMIHFNINHPENWNYFISNLRGNKANVYNGKRFELEDKVESLRKLIYSKKEFLEVFIKEIEDLLEIDKEIALDALNYFENVEEEYKYVTKELLKKTEELAYNKREKMEIIKKNMDKKNREDYKSEIKL